MTEMTNDDQNPLRQPPEADAMEQHHPVVEGESQPDLPRAIPPETSPADVTEQAIPVTDEPTDPMPTSVPDETNPADVVEQHQGVVPDQDDHRE